MKKTFQLTHPKIKYARLVDAVRNEVKKYLKRERGKTLPEGFEAWDFACKFGETSEVAKVIDVASIAKAINDVETQQLEAFYLEILAKPGYKPEKSQAQPEQPLETNQDI